MSARDAYPTQFYDTPQELPAEVDQSALNANGLFMFEGLNEDLARQLVEASKQPHIGYFCPNDPGSRFGDIDRVRIWQAKKRLALPLVRKAGDGALVLAGFGWMGPQQPGEDELTLPGATTTFAIRLYENAVGQGNGAPFTKAILAVHDALYGNEGVWLETWADNKKALASYREAGFKDSGMLLSERDGRSVWRQYMRLGNVAVAKPAEQPLVEQS